MKAVYYISCLALAFGAGCKRIDSNSSVIPFADIPETTSVLKQTAPKSAGYLKVDKLTLTSRNTLNFRGVVTTQKVTEMQVALQEMSRNLSSTEVIYLVLDTPGGSVEAGRQFIDTVHSIPQEVKTITVFAASMGFQFVENMGERLIVPSGTLMSHRATFSGVGGQVPGELVTRLNFDYRNILKLEANDAARMHLTLAQYQALVHDEYWVDGQDAVAQNAADRMVLATCDASFSGTEDVYLGEVFGIKVFGVMSKCPLFTGILTVKLQGGDQSGEKAQLAINAAKEYSNRRSFVDKFILGKQ